MPRTQYEVRLTPDERTTLTRLTTSGVSPARTQTRARILLRADRASGQPRALDADIATALGCATRTVARVRLDWTVRGMATIHPRPRVRTTPHKLSEDQIARILAITVDTPPAGHEHWTLRLLTERVIELQIVPSICPETIRTTLKKTDCNPGKSAGS